MAIDPLRHLDVFSPAEFGDRRIDVIGVGATGSRIALSLAKLGIRNIHVWDPDVIETHNIANQVYGLDDLGKRKAEALQTIIKQQTGTEITVHIQRVGEELVELGSVVFLLTDTMKSRKEIWQSSIRYRLSTDIMIETRMGAESGRIYTIQPMSPGQIQFWEGSLYDDDDAEVSACGASISVGPTAELVSGYAVWQMIRWFQNSIIGLEDTDPPECEMIFSIKPPLMITQTVKKGALINA